MIISDPKDKAEALNEQYTSVFTRELTNTLPIIESSQFSSMSDIMFTIPGIEKLLQNLNPAKASGPDLLPTRILKMVARKVSPVLTVIFQQSCDTGVVPSDCSQANITAFFKNGEKTNPANTDLFH